MSHTDLFKGKSHSDIYSKYRPPAPQYVVDNAMDYLREKVPGPYTLALDVGCGTGTSTRLFAPHFAKVIATDVSESMLDKAKTENNFPNVEYRLCSSDHLPAEDESVQLISAFASLQWFDHPKFFKEVQRVLVPGGILAVFAAQLPTMQVKDSDQTALIAQQIDKVFEILKPFWHERIQVVRQNYRPVEFPFEEVVRPPNQPDAFLGTLADYVGYVKSLSVFHTYRKQSPLESENVIEEFIKNVTTILGTNSAIETYVQIIRFCTTVMSRKPFFRK